MEDRRLYFLVKFGKYEFMKQLFDNGSIYMQRLRAFQGIEHAQIGDKHEGLSHSLQPSQVFLEVNGVRIDGVVGPVRIVDDTSYNPLIFCLYGFTNECINESGKHIDARCCEFGEYAVVITDVKEFYKKIVDAFQKVGNGKAEARLIEYVSYNGHHGEMGPFKKYDYFEHQSEFRLVYEDNELAPTFILNVGSLDGVAILCRSDQVNDLIQVNTSQTS